MARIVANVSFEEIENDEGRYIDGCRVTCSKCSYSVEVFGDGDASQRRGAVMLHEECPLKENNFYALQ